MLGAWKVIEQPTTVEKTGSPEGKTEASVGVEPTMVDLQSTALATWLRRPMFCDYVIESKFDGQVG